MEKTGVKLALAASGAIGDGAVSLVLAHNLARNGFEVSFYSNAFAQLRSWLPWAAAVKPWPTKEGCKEEFARYDLVLADNASILGTAKWSRQELEAMAGEYLYVGLERVPDFLKRDHRERLKAKLSPELFKRVERVAAYSGDVRYRHGDRTINMADCAALLAKEEWGLSDVVSSAGLTPPPELDLKPCKASKRVILHPFSGLERKNWPLAKYIAFARWLRREGWAPEFCCAASERETLLPALKGEFEAPVCANLSEFAARIYESFALVGNDSGPVHLASCLGVRTMTISLRGRMHRWRPGWRQGVIILPLLKVKFSVANVWWKPFTPVWQVERGFKALLAQGGSAPQAPLYS